MYLFLLVKSDPLVQSCCKIGNKRGSKGQPPLCGGLGASPSLFFSRARRAQRNFATALLHRLTRRRYSFPSVGKYFSWYYLLRRSSNEQEVYHQAPTNLFGPHGYASRRLWWRW